MLLPGVALHEGSHWLAAKLLRVPTRRFSLLPRRTKDDKVRFGYVETAKVDPLRASLIGLAPLLVGAICLELLALEHLGMRQLGELLGKGDWPAVLGQISGFLSTPGLLLWLYLIFAISNTMLPSRSDRAAWLSALVFLGAAVVTVAAAGALEGVMEWLAPWARGAAQNLAGVLWVAAAVDLVLVIPILLSEVLLTRLFGWEVVY